MISEHCFLKLLRLIPHNQTFYSPIKGLLIHHSSQPFEYEGIIQEPSICIVLRGKREIQLGNQCYLFDNQHFMFCPVNLPMRGKIHQASPESPFVVASMKLDFEQIREILISQAHLFEQTRDSKEIAFSPWQLDQALAQAFERLLSLHENPDDIDFLAPLIQKEIYYRLLQGSQGQKLKQMVNLGSNTQQIAKATEYLQTHFAEPIAIQTLADLCHMSISGFYEHFKKITTLSPLQYQKSLRLNQAKKCLIEGKQHIAHIAYQVGYESPSQFSREYRRYFGHPPSKDLKALAAYLSA